MKGSLELTPKKKALNSDTNNTHIHYYRSVVVVVTNFFPPFPIILGSPNLVCWSVGPF